MARTELERGAAKISVELRDGRLVVRHGSDNDVLIERDAERGTWDALFRLLENK